MRTKPRTKTLYDIQIRRQILRQKIEMTEALIGKQCQRLESKIPAPRMGLNLISYIASIGALMALKRANRSKDRMNFLRLDKNSRGRMWRKCISIVSSLLISLLRRRFGK